MPGGAKDPGDDGDGNEGEPPAKKASRNTRLQKLTKKGSEAAGSSKDGAPKKEKPMPAKNSKAQEKSPRLVKASNKRLEKALTILETLKKAELPNLACPAELKQQSLRLH